MPASHAISGTLVANTVTAIGFTSWQPYIEVQLTNGATAAYAYVTVDGTVPTTNGTDVTAIWVAANATVTTSFRNPTPKPELNTVTPGPTDPAAVTSLTTHNSNIGVLSAQAMTYNVQFATQALSPVLA